MDNYNIIDQQDSEGSSLDDDISYWVSQGYSTYEAFDIMEAMWEGDKLG